MLSFPFSLIRSATHSDVGMRYLLSFKNLNLCHSFRPHTTAQDLQNFFVDPKIHKLLRLVTYRNVDVVHKPRFRRLQDYTIKMLSDKELQAVKDFTAAFTSQRLQMPPVLAPRNADVKGQLISTDAGLQGLFPSNNRLVFTDISLGRGRKDRLIVIREPNGDLRHASTSERERINGVYFPLPGRRLRIPLMFSPEHLQPMLERRQFLYILDRACTQFEPDDPHYTQVCHAVYDAVNKLAWTPLHSDSDEMNPLRSLRHTRHFGPLALYMIVQLSNPGPLVYEALSCQHFARLGWLLQLIALVRPKSKFAAAVNKIEPTALLPSPDINANDVSSDQAELSLSPSDALRVLSLAEVFVENDPLHDSYKRLLKEQIKICRENLQATDISRTTG